MSNLRINNVRISYPVLFRPKGFEGNDQAEKKYSAVFVLDKQKNKKDLRDIQNAIRAVIDEKWGDKRPKNIKLCLIEASEKEGTYSNEEDLMLLSSSTPRRPPVVGKNPENEVHEDDDEVWPGCFVNASVRFWAQDNKYGKRVNCELRAVQTLAKGDRWGGPDPVDPNEEFESYDDEDDEDEDYDGLL